jgi:hypothetical protein
VTILGKCRKSGMFELEFEYRYNIIDEMSLFIDVVHRTNFYLQINLLVYINKVQIIWCHVHGKTGEENT